MKTAILSLGALAALVLAASTGPGLAADADLAIAPFPPPSGWVTYSSRPELFRMGTTRMFGTQEAEAVVVAQNGPSQGAAGGVMRTVGVEAFRGQRVRLTARLKLQGAMTQLWLAAALPGGERRANRDFQGTTDWQAFTMVIDVPANAVRLSYGFRVTGGTQEGQAVAWGDSFTLEAVGKDVRLSPSTPAIRRAASTGPYSFATGAFEQNWSNGQDHYSQELKAEAARTPPPPPQ